MYGFSIRIKSACGRSSFLYSPISFFYFSMAAILSFLAWTCLLFLLFRPFVNASLILPITSFYPDSAAFTSTASSWSSYNAATVYHGPCLDNGLTAPIYNRTLVVTFYGTNPPDVVMTWIGICLLREVLGYNTVLYDVSSVTPPYFEVGFTVPQQLVVNGESLIILGDLTFTSGYESVIVADWDFSQRTYVGDGLLLKNMGAHDALDRSSIFVDTRSVNANLDLHLLDWQSYSNGVETDLFTNIYVPNSLEKETQVQKVVNVSKAAAWSIVHDPSFSYYIADTQVAGYLGLNCTAMPYACVACPPDALLGSLGLLAGCNNPQYPSMFIPPQCEPNPEELCTVMFVYPPLDAGTAYTSAILNLNMSIVVAYVSYGFFYNPAFIQGEVPLLISSSTFFQFGTSLCEVVNPSSQHNVTINCFQPMQFPAYDTYCSTLFNGNYNSYYFCEPMPNIHYKFMTHQLIKDAPRVDYLLQNMNFNKKMLLDAFYATSTGDLKLNARQWLLNHESVWQAWIQPPAVCTYEDYTFQEGPCDASIDLKSIVFTWWMPKACQGGVELPPPTSISCGLVAPQNSAYTILYVVMPCMVALILGVFLLFMLFAYTKETHRRFGTPFYHHVTQHRHLRLFGKHGFVVLTSAYLLLLLYIPASSGYVNPSSCITRIMLIVTSGSMCHQWICYSVWIFWCHLKKDQVSHVSPKLLQHLMGFVIAMQIVVLVGDHFTTSLSREGLTLVDTSHATVYAYCGVPSTWTIGVVLVTQGCVGLILLTLLVRTRILLRDQIQRVIQKHITPVRPKGPQSPSTLISRKISLVVKKNPRETDGMHTAPEDVKNIRLFDTITPSFSNTSQQQRRWYVLLKAACLLYASSCLILGFTLYMSESTSNRMSNGTVIVDAVILAYVGIAFVFLYTRKTLRMIWWYVRMHKRFSKPVIPFDDQDISEKLASLVTMSDDKGQRTTECMHAIKKFNDQVGMNLLTISYSLLVDIPKNSVKEEEAKIQEDPDATILIPVKDPTNSPTLMYHTTPFAHIWAYQKDVMRDPTKSSGNHSHTMPMSPTSFKSESNSGDKDIFDSKSASADSSLLITILDNPLMTTYFHAFMRDTLSQENLEFILAFIDLHKLAFYSSPVCSPVELSDKVILIHTIFIDQINLPEGTMVRMKNRKKQFEEWVVDVNNPFSMHLYRFLAVFIYVEAFWEIYKLILVNSFVSKFMVSEYHHKFITDIQALFNLYSCDPMRLSSIQPLLKNLAQLTPSPTPLWIP